MVTAALLSPVAFRLVLPSQSSSKYKPTMCCPRRSNSLNTCRNKPDSPPLHAFQVKGQTQGPPKKNVTEKRLKQLHLKPRQLDIIMDTFGGRLQNGGLVFQQHFMIRSYELDPDGKVSIVALVNRLQESALNHLKSVGLHADGFGSTPEMHRRDLIWAAYRLQIEVECRSSWADVFQGEIWISSASAKHLKFGWLVRDCKTGETLIRANSLYLMINKKTRKVSFAKEVGAEIKPHVMNCDPLINQDKKKLPHLDFDTADYVRTGFKPLWNDLDINQHVNHVKYISWILESTPRSILDSYNLSVMTLEYRKECGRDSILQSLTAFNKDGTDHFAEDEGVEFDHKLCLEDGTTEILRGKTKWMPKIYGEGLKNKLMST